MISLSKWCYPAILSWNHHYRAYNIMVKKIISSPSKPKQSFTANVNNFRTCSATTTTTIRTQNQHLSTLPLNRNSVAQITKRMIAHKTQFHVPQEKVQVDDVYLNYTKVGNGNHVVLCLPGALGSIETDFEPIIMKMDQNKFTVVCWDPPGYGKSRPPNRVMGNHPQANDAQLASKLMQKLNFDNYSILGWSNGGATGAHIAARNPEKIHRFVTWGAPAFINQSSMKLAKLILTPSNWNQPVRQSLIRVYGEEYLNEMTQDTYNYVERSVRHGTFQIKLLFPTIQSPTLILHGAKDIHCPIEHANAYKEGIPKSKLEVWPKATHYLHLEFPDKFVERVQKFLLADE